MAVVDILIIGAGPAGSSAGYFLAKGGLKPVIADQAKFPRDKVCGDGLTPRSATMLEKLGLRNRIEGKYRTIRAVRMTSPYGMLADLDMPPECFGGSGYVVPRKELDQILLDNAREAGAEFLEGHRLNGITVEPEQVVCSFDNGAKIAARVVIACDGANSIVRRKLKLDHRPEKHGAWAIRAYYSGVDSEAANAFEICWDKELLPAYGWSFPLENGRANVGLGIREDDLRKSGKKLPELFDAFVKDNPRMKLELRNAESEGKPRGHYLPFGSFIDRLTADRVIFAGDAAGFIHPLTGEGIEYALESGQAAANTLLALWKQGSRFTVADLKPYGEECNRRFGHTMKTGYTMQRLFRFPRLVERSMRMAVKDDAIKRQFAEILIGDGQKISFGLIRRVLIGV